MKVRLEQSSPNFCFELIDVDSGESVEFIQTDWDYPGLASSFGWVACDCGATDGTVDCEHRTASDMISEAFDYLCDHDGEVIDYEN